MINYRREIILIILINIVLTASIINHYKINLKILITIYIKKEIN